MLGLRSASSVVVVVVVVGILSCLTGSLPERGRAEEPVLNDHRLSWERLAPLPDPRGVAAPFAGIHGTALLVGGGANFPDKLPWEGGQKVWYDRVWVLDDRHGSWREAGHLPRRLAYGVSISTPEGVICVGGSDAERHFADVFRLAWRGGTLETTPLPALPRPVANACGAMLGSTILIAGGTESPDATSTLKVFLALDLAEKSPRWETLETWPGPPRMLAVAAVQDESFFLVSGTDLSADDAGKPKRRYLTDAYRFRPGAGWRRIADVPRAVVAAPSPAPPLGTTRFLVIGGDDGANVGFQPPERHPGFSTDVLAHDTRSNGWTTWGDTPAPRVTVPTVEWGERWLVISGERRPGVRSPEVWSLQVIPRSTNPRR
jgi:N-acetylneuraminic acid mutarotase